MTDTKKTTWEEDYEKLYTDYLNNLELPTLSNTTPLFVYKLGFMYGANLQKPFINSLLKTKREAMVEMIGSFKGWKYTNSSGCISTIGDEDIDEIIRKITERNKMKNL